jgi:hypothetical protein
MKRFTNNSNDLLDVALDEESGEIIIGRIRLRPVGPDSDNLKIRKDDAAVVFDAVVRFRDEAWRWRHWAQMYLKWIKSVPSIDLVYKDFHK